MPTFTLLEGTIDDFIDEQENKNTRAKTDRDVSLLKPFHQWKKDLRNVEEYYDGPRGSQFSFIFLQFSFSNSSVFFFFLVFTVRFFFPTVCFCFSFFTVMLPVGLREIVMEHRVQVRWLHYDESNENLLLRAKKREVEIGSFLILMQINLNQKTSWRRPQRCFY